MKNPAQPNPQRTLWQRVFFGLVKTFILLSLTLLFVLNTTPKAFGAGGINRVINFQGKIVKKADGTNISDGTYSFTFKIYDAASGGNLLWQETQSSVSVTSGIFQVSLGSSTAFNAGGYNVNFNQNNLYLDISFNGETFGSRIPLASVPYAVNSEQLDGVIATQSASGFSLAGGTSTPSVVSFTTGSSTLTLQPGITEGLTVESNGANALTLDTGAASTLNIANNNATALQFGGSQNPTYTFSGTNTFNTSSGLNTLGGNVTINGTSLTSSTASFNLFNTIATTLNIGGGATSAINLGNAAGKIDISGAVGIGTTSPSSLLSVGSTSQFQINSSGAITAATGITSSGTITFSAFTSNGGPLYTNGSGVLAQTTAGTSAQCLLGGTTPTFGSCGTGITTDPFWSSSLGALYPNNSTEDLLIGGQSTSSAKFGFLNVNSGSPTATISGNLSLVVPTGNAPADTFNVLNNGSLNFQRSVGGDGGLASTLYLGNTGNVGIGTTAPSESLEVVGGNILLDNGQSLKFKDSTGTSRVGLSWDTSDNFKLSNPVSTGNIIIQLNNATSNGSIQFNTENTQRMVINSNGSVGIGTTNPSAIFDVNGTASISGQLDLYGTPQLQSTNNKTLTFGGSTTGGIQFQPGNSSSSLYLAASGNVGIGTGSPVGALDVRGNSGTTSVASISGQTSFASFVVDNAGNGDLFTASTSGFPRFSITSNGTNKFFGSTSSFVGLQGPAAGDTTTYVLPSATGSNGQVLSILSTGNSTTLQWIGSLVQTPTSTGQNTISPATSNVVGLTVNGTNTGTPAPVGIFNQVGSADILDLNGNITLPAGTITNGLLVNMNHSSENMTNGINITNSAGTLTNGLTFTGTFGTDLINAPNFSVTNAGLGTFSSDVAINGSNLTTTTSTFNLFNTNATTLNIGGGATSAINLGNAQGVIDIKGQVGIGTARPIGVLDAVGDSGTTSVATISGNTSFATFVIDNSGTGDLFTASTSGLTRFRITNTGSALFEGKVIAEIGSGASGNGSNTVVNALGDQGSLIPNANFESANNASTFADGWYDSTSSAFVTRDTTNAALGDSSMKVTLGNNGSAAVYSTCIPYAGNNALASDNLNWYQLGGSGTKQTVTAILEGYTSQVNCQSDTTPEPALVFSSVTLSNWKKVGTNTNRIQNFVNNNLWARLEFLVTCPSTCTSPSTTNIGGVRLIESSLGKGVDYAENYPADPSNIAKPGQIVSLEAVSSGSAQVVPTNKPMDNAMIGVVSTNPGEVLDDGSVTGPKVPIALAGRIPVSVSTENGVIHLGDYLTSSNIPGVAVKATKAGQVIGVAMENDTDSNINDVGQVIMFIKNTYFAGISTSQGQTDALSALGTLVQQSETSNTTDLSITNTDRLVAGLDVITPKLVTKDVITDTISPATGSDVTLTLSDGGAFVIKGLLNDSKVQFDVKGDGFFTGTLSADTIIANHIKGLDIITNQLTQLSSVVATLSANMAVLGTDTLATPSSAVNIATPSGVNLQSFTVGFATVSGDFRVKGNGLFEGILSVIDTLTTNNFIVNGMTDFFNTVIFHGNVHFSQSPTFNADTAGTILVSKGQDHVTVMFHNAYAIVPVVTANIVNTNDALSQAILQEGYTYIVTDITTTGFTIKLNKSVQQEISFSWIALAVDSSVTLSTPTPILPDSTFNSASGSAAP